MRKNNEEEDNKAKGGSDKNPFQFDVEKYKPFLEETVIF